MLPVETKQKKISRSDLAKHRQLWSDLANPRSFEPQLADVVVTQNEREITEPFQVDGDGITTYYSDPEESFASPQRQQTLPVLPAYAVQPSGDRVQTLKKFGKAAGYVAAGAAVGAALIVGAEAYRYLSPFSTGNKKDQPQRQPAVGPRQTGGQEMQRAASAIQTLKDENGTLRQQVSELRTAYQIAGTKLHDASQQIQTLQAAGEQIKAQAGEKLQQAGAFIQQTLNERQILEQALQDQATRNQQLTAVAQQLDGQTQQLAGENQQLAAAHQQVVTQAQRIAGENQQLRTALSRVTNGKNGNRGENRGSNTGRMSGVAGPAAVDGAKLAWGATNAAILSGLVLPYITVKGIGKVAGAANKARIIYASRQQNGQNGESQTGDQVPAEGQPLPPMALKGRGEKSSLLIRYQERRQAQQKGNEDDIQVKPSLGEKIKNAVIRKPTETVEPESGTGDISPEKLEMQKRRETIAGPRWKVVTDYQDAVDQVVDGVEQGTLTPNQVAAAQQSDRGMRVEQKLADSDPYDPSQAANIRQARTTGNQKLRSAAQRFQSQAQKPETKAIDDNQK